ncbi:MAG: zinc-ribbon domain-containing protein [Chloroflexi bacterium]|jgi:DNA-directed RNA polymerase subunit RPC12/RpoP|nr:zinc-ribbon domain-containing protein [Chloroflexota bacterium]
MSFQDKSIKCSDCSTTFTFSAGEQEFFRSKGFAEEPRRCPMCRAKRKTQRQDSNSRSW